MSWEKRRNTERLYYRRKVQRDGRSCREYVGCGPEAEQLAAEDAARREQRNQERAARHLEDSENLAADHLLNEWWDRLDDIAAATLVVAGFYKHGGEWRLRRNHEQIDEANDHADLSAGSEGDTGQGAGG